MPNRRDRQQGIMTIDWTRKDDLEELAEKVEKSRTQGERDHYKQIMYSLLNESEDILYWRDQLLKAVRTESKDRKSYCIAMIQKIKQDQTNGNAWGNNKSNLKYVN